MRYISTLLLLFSFTTFSFSQQPEQTAVPLTAAFDTGTPEVTLSWPSETDVTAQELYRREEGGTWAQVIVETASPFSTTYTDTDVAVGGIYEYGFLRAAGGVVAASYATVAIEAPVVDHRGTVLIVVEEALQTPLADELDRLNNDLIGDGWKTIWHPIGEDATVETVKAQIVAEYENAPDEINSVFLMGEIPVPYSGLVQWDGHTNHIGAWVADTYYGEMDGNWTDQSVNNTSASRAANHNIPGDGKFDNSTIPSPVELAVGRVDFSNLSETTFETSRVELMRRYLDKNHRWRAKEYTVENKALVDDNFGYFSGEAFSGSGYRNYYNLVGFDNVSDGDFLSDTDDQSYLFAYGCGGGSYTSANGIGNSANFAADSVNAVFTMIFGSYHGDWDSENNPFMMSALASRGGILSCSWAGRPHWFYHPLGGGKTLGECALISQNAGFDNVHFSTFATGGAHTTLLGDPTLRAHIVAPVSNPIAIAECAINGLEWTASPAPGLVGYHIYRADAMDGDYVRLTTSPTDDLFFIDDNPLPGENFYQIKAIVLEETPTGAYFNSSTGIFTSVVANEELELTVLGETLIPCFGDLTTLVANSNTPGATFDWVGLADPSNPVQMLPAGTYFLVVSDVNGCTYAEAINVGENPQLTLDLISSINCDGSIELSPSISGGEPPYSFISNPPSPIPPDTDFTIIVTDNNGCMIETEGFTPPFTAMTVDIDFTNETVAGLNDGTATAEPQNGESPFIYSWSNGESTQTITDLAPGVYSVTITGANGCEAVATVIIQGGVSSTSDIPGLLSLNLFPNPTDGNFGVSISLVNTENISLNISDINGRIIYQAPTISASQNKWELDLNDFPAGIYMCKITVGENSVSRQVVVR